MPAGTDQVRATKLLEKSEHVCLVSNSLVSERSIESTIVFPSSGEIVPLEMAPLTGEDTHAAIYHILTDLQKRAFEEAMAIIRTGDFDKAIEEFRAAYALHPLPELLFNIAQSHRLAGRCRQAVLAYESYLRKDPEGNRSKDAKDWIGELGSCGSRVGLKVSMKSE